MKSNKKRILFVLAILTMALVLSCAFVACDKKDTGDKPNSNDLGVYYEVVGSSLDEKSYIELKSGNVWYDGEDQGTFKINGGNITLYDGDLELMSGTISNGVLTLSFMGETTVYKKSGSMGSGNVDQKAMIKSIQNGKVDGLTVSLEIDNTVEDVDLSGMITTSKDCSWQLYTSRTATSADAIVTKIIVPKNGNNTYYIVVTSADGKTNRTYTLNVWKNYYVTLSFYANGTLYTSEQVLTHTTYGSGPSCSVAGYTFNGWGCDGYYVTESKSFNANLTPLTYSAKFDSNGGSTVSNKTATFNKDLSLPTPYRTGYTFLGWYLNGNLYKDSIKYTYTNDVTFTARWQINSYNVVIKSDNEELGTVQAYNGKKDYNSSVSLSATTKLGCSFVGWFANGTKISTNKTCTINVPAYNVTYVAIFKIDENLANFRYSITENSCVIKGVLDKNITTVLIPDYVTDIDYHAFYNCTGLTSVTIPDSVTSIYGYAFESCTGLTSVTIGNGMTRIDSNAFWGCYRLVEVYNKSTLSITAGSSSNGSIAYYAKNVYKNEGGSKLTTDENGYVIYTDGDEKILVAYLGTETELALPSYITKINQYAFYGCSSLTSITIPDSVKSIGNYAFWGCKGITTVNWNATKCTSAGSHDSPIFKGCSNLATVNIGDNVKIIPSYAFYYCTRLTSITIPDSVTSIGWNAFSGCSGLTSITIPDSVTSIGAGNFESCTGLTSVTIPDSVTSIDERAFRGCTGLTSITIPDSVTSIGSSAFSGCSGLTSVTIPDSVTSIGSSAFSGCSSLKSMTLPFVGASETASNGYAHVFGYIFGYTISNSSSSVSVATYQYYGYSKYYHYYIPSSIKSVTITGGNIPSYAFRNCSGLTSVTIGNGVTSIDYEAFSGCTGLTSVTIPNSVTSIGSSAFSGCSGLTSVTIPDSVTSIGSSAFSGCSGLTSVTIPDSVTSIGENAFSGCSSLESITIPFVGAKAGVTSSDTYQYPFGYIFGTSSYTGGVATTQYYYGSSTLDTTNTTYYIPSSLKSVTVTGGNILYRAFYNCSGLTSITITDSVTSIGSTAFYDCTRLTSVTIPDSVTNIGRSAFDGTAWYINQPDGLVYAGKVAYKYKGTMPSNTSIVLKEGTLGITASAFERCSGLTSVTIPDSVTSIGGGAFYGCTGLKSITIPNSVTSIGGSAFDNTAWYNNQPDGLVYAGKVAYKYKGTMPSNTSIVLKEGTLSIAGSAFYGCSGLTSITIPNSVTSIGSSAFSGCRGLTSVTIPDSVTSIGDNAFRNCKWLTSITIGNNVTSIGERAFMGCDGLTSVTIGKGVTSIGAEAFNYCSLTTINFNGTIAQWNAISKGVNWKERVPSACNVVCTDGTISISEA